MKDSGQNCANAWLSPSNEGQAGRGIFPQSQDGLLFEPFVFVIFFVISKPLEIFWAWQARRRKHSGETSGFSSLSK
jgi:hypothetical protein